MIELRQSQPRRHSGLSALIEAATAQLGGSTVVKKVKSIKPEADGETQEMMPKPDPNRQSFPELLMTLAVDPANSDVITFLPDGKFFAIRAKQFSEEIMIHYFAVTAFNEFLELSSDWGFSIILKDKDEASGIEVLRHPLFIMGDWEKCTRIKFGESPTDARVSALPEQAKIEYCLSEDSNNPAPTPINSPTSTKRRLSPGMARRGSESSKLRAVSKDMEVPNIVPPTVNDRSRSDSDTADSLPAACLLTQSQTDELRSVALAITTEKLKLKNDDASLPQDSTTLIEEAVESCTQTIVTDAIETLLRDKSHSKETYLRHESELGKSCLPGVVPISKQLFSPQTPSEKVPSTTESSPPSEVTTKRPSVSPPTLDETKNQGDVTASSVEASPETSPTLKPTPTIS